MEDLTHIPLKKLSLSAANPRSEHNDSTLLELSGSINEVGVLQPIIVRPVTKGKKKDEFEIVCGERRFLAAKLSKLVSIPAFIRDLDDQQAFELTITENLQRKDITVMEEVAAFCKLVENGYTVQDIAVKFGKPERFVRLRLKLAQMIDPFKELMAREVITPAIAEAVATMPAQSQQFLYDRHFAQHQTNEQWRCPSLRQVSDFKQRYFQADLGSATFPLDDETILPSAGACTACPHNTDNDLVLFSREDEGSKCLNVPCFQQKTELAFKANLARIQEDQPEVVIGFDQHVWGEEEAKVSQIIESGVEAVELDNDWRRIAPPEEPDLDNLADEDKDMALMEFSFNKESYQKDLESPDAVKVFMISGEDKGKTVLFKYNPRRPELPNPLATSPATLSIHAQINKLEERAKRTEEIRFEKIYEAAKDVMEDKFSRYTSLEMPLMESEKTAFYVGLVDFLDPDFREELFVDRFSTNQRTKALAEDISPELSNRLVRAFIKNRTKVGNATFEKGKAECLIEVVSGQFAGSFLSDRDRIAQTYDRRIGKINIALAELRGALERGSGDDPVNGDYSDTGLDDNREEDPDAVPAPAITDKDND